MRYSMNKTIMTVVLLLSATMMWAGEISVVKKLNGSTNSNAGTVTSSVSNGKCTLTVTPANGNYITVDFITAERTISGAIAQAPRRAPGMDNDIEVSATSASADPSGITKYTFDMPDAAYDVEVVADFQSRTSISGATITLSQTTFTYDAEEKTPAVSSVVVGSKTLSTNEYSVAYSNNTDAGKGVVTVSGLRTYTGTATAEFTIGKAAITPTVTLQGWTYNGNPNTPVVTGNTGNGQVTFTYKAEGATEFTAERPTAAGTHTVKATIAETANYLGNEATAEFTIGKAAITPAVTLQGWTYNGNPNTPVVTGNTGNGQVTFTYKAEGATEFTAELPTAAGTHTVKATIAETANYLGNEATAEFTIGKAAITPIVTLLGWTYNGNPNTPVVTGNTGNGQVTYTYKAEGATEFTAELPTAAGTHTVKATIAETANYLGNEATAEFTIGKAAITPAVSLQGWQEGNKPNAPVVTGNTGNGQVTFTYKAEDAKDFTEDVPTVAGTYTVKATIAETANYLGNEATAEFTITPALIYIGNVAVSEENRKDILNDGGSVQFDGEHLLKLTNATLTDAITTTLDQLTIFLVGSNSITTTTAAIIGNGSTLTFTTEGNNPGTLTMTTTEASAVLQSVTTVIYSQNLTVLDGATNTATASIGTPVKPIVDESGETNTINVGGEGDQDLNNVVVNDVLYTLDEDEYESDKTDNSLLLTNTMAEEDMEDIIAKYAPGTPEFAEHFSGLTFMVPAGYGKIIVNAKTGEDGIMKVKVGSLDPYIISGALEITEFEFSYACQEATYVYIYNASEAVSVAEAAGNRAGKKTTVTVGLSSVGVSASGVQASNTSGDYIDTEKVILSDADVEYDAENATLKAINNEVNSLYEESFVSFPFLKYIDLRNTKITGINVSREEGAFKGVSKNTFIYVPAGNTTSESNVVIGSICESVLLDGDMSETESFGLSGSFTASSIDFARTFQKDEVATLYLPFPISEGDKESFGTFYTIEKVTGGKVKIVEVEGEIKAHIPYLFKAAADDTELYNLDVVEMGMPEQAAGARRTDVAVQLIGCYDNIYSDGEDNAFRFVPDANVENLTFVRMQKDERIKPFEAYLLTDAEGDTLGVTDKDAAGIKQVDSLQVTVDSWYDLQGRKVKGHLKKGIYINNGQKTVIR